MNTLVGCILVGIITRAASEGIVHPIVCAIGAGIVILCVDLLARVDERKKERKGGKPNDRRTNQQSAGCRGCGMICLSCKRSYQESTNKLPLGYCSEICVRDAHVCAQQDTIAKQARVIDRLKVKLEQAEVAKEMIAKSWRAQIALVEIKIAESEAALKVLAERCNPMSCSNCPLRNTPNCSGMNCGSKLLKWAKQEAAKPTKASVTKNNADLKRRKGHVYGNSHLCKCGVSVESCQCPKEVG